MCWTMSPMTEESNASAFYRFQRSRRSRAQTRRLPSSLRILIGAIDASNGLQKDMIAHGLVKIHTIENRGIEASEQFLSNNEDLWILSGLTKSLRMRFSSSSEMRYFARFSVSLNPLL